MGVSSGEGVGSVGDARDGGCGGRWRPGRWCRGAALVVAAVKWLAGPAPKGSRPEMLLQWLGLMAILIAAWLSGQA